MHTSLLRSPSPPSPSTLPAPISAPLPHAHAGPSASSDASKIRAYAACRSCRAKKVKCVPGSRPGVDGAPGTCAQCEASRLECTYPPTRDRAAYSRQYVQNLELRVQALEVLQARLVPLLDAFERGEVASGSNGASAATAPRTFTLKPLVDEPESRTDGGDPEEPNQEQDSSVGDEPDDGGQMAQDHRGNYRWIGSSNTLSLLDSFSHSHTRTPNYPTPEEAEEKESNPYFGPVAGSGVVKALPAIDEVDFPKRDYGDALVDAFFREIYPALPVFEEKAFREEYNDLMDRRERGVPSKTGGFITVAFAVFALGERVIAAAKGWQRQKEKAIRAAKQVSTAQGSDDSILPGEAEAGVIWFERAQILHYSTLNDVNLYQVQCLTLMAAFQASVNAMPMSWLFAGKAMRVALDLGLHRSSARMRLPFVERQVRARCWWALYGLERLVSVQLGRPLGVDDLDIDLALPLPIDDETLASIPRTQYEAPEIGEEAHGCTMSGFIALTKLCTLAGKVAQVLYRPSHGRSNDPSWEESQQNSITKLDRELKDWLEKDVPKKYTGAADEPRVQLVTAILSNAYFAVLLTLHRNVLPSNPDYPRARPPSNSQSLSHLVEAARSIIHVAAQQRVLLPPSHHLAAACHSLWSSAIVLLLCEVQARDQVVVDAVGSSVESCRQTLETYEPAWPGARKLKELLVEVEARAKEVALRGHAHARRKRRAGAHDVTAPPPKRQSSSGNGGGNGSGMPPPGQPTFSSSPHRKASWAHTSSFAPTPGSMGRVYETSDTRTMVDDSAYSQSPAIHRGGSSSGRQPSSASSTFRPSPTIPSPSVAHRPHSQSYTRTSGNVPPPGQEVFSTQPFDTGDMTFDALEMLHGFDFASLAGLATISGLAGGDASASGSTGGANGGGGDATPGFWNDFISPSGAAGYVISGTSTPSGNGYSPASAGGGQTQGQGQGGPQGLEGVRQGQVRHGQVQGGQDGAGGVGIGGIGLPGFGSDFWSQLAPGGGFDWASDPNVPFNI